MQPKETMARRVAGQKVQLELIQKKKNPTKPKKGVKGKEKEKEKVNIDIKMATPRRFAKNEIQNTGKKEDLIDLWENNFSDAWKQDSKIKGMYENKLSEFED